jgi:hypothetical protein
LAVTVANAAATAGRFLLLRHWVFGPRSKGTPMEPSTATQSLQPAGCPGGFWKDGPPDDDLYGPSPWATPAVDSNGGGDSSAPPVWARIAAVVGAVVIALGTVVGVRAAIAHDAATPAAAGNRGGFGPVGGPGGFGPRGVAPGAAAPPAAVSGSVPRVPR